ncbi:MAG: hypothetical protein RLY86_1562 [Pseudomonadota bacterium]|jgi:nucleotide-binding universal stress UspA family protein
MFRDLLVHVRPGLVGTALSAAEGPVAVALALAGAGGVAAGARVTAVMTFRAIAMLRQIFPQGGPDVEREAARVATLSAAAERVHVLEGRARGSGPSITKPASADIQAHLRRHARVVEVLSTGVDGTMAGAAILDAAAATDSDLIVMGAYGRPWISEWLLGGATRQVLRDTTVPVLLAH